LALSGIQVYKQLPQTNCKDCGYPTCLAFAMKVVSKQTELTTCSHLSIETKQFLQRNIFEESKNKTDESKRIAQTVQPPEEKFNNLPGKLFVCYSRKDESFTLEIAQNLKDKGVDIWIDQWNIPFGSDWDRSIDDALCQCSALMIILSPDSCDSTEVRCELRTALDEKKLVIPVLYRKCRIPRQLRIVQYFDFSSESKNKETLINQIINTLDTLQ